VVVSVGTTRRLPLASTVPNPWSIETDVASVTDQRTTADWPRSIDEGSTEKSATVGVPGPAEAAVVPPEEGGGGGGIGTFFPQAAMKTADSSMMDKQNRNGA
jgi:hypothetical protein